MEFRSLCPGIDNSLHRSRRSPAFVFDTTRLCQWRRRLSDLHADRILIHAHSFENGKRKRDRQLFSRGNFLRNELFRELCKWKLDYALRGACQRLIFYRMVRSVFGYGYILRGHDERGSVCGGCIYRHLFQWRHELPGVYDDDECRYTGVYYGRGGRRLLRRTGNGNVPGCRRQ